MSIKPRYIQPTLFPEEEFVKEDSSVREEFDLTDLFERLAKSNFRSKFHLSNKDKEYIEEKGLATIRKHAEDLLPNGWHLYTSRMTESKLPCEVIPYSWLSTLQAVVAVAALQSGTTSLQEDNLLMRNNNMPWPYSWHG